MSFSSRLSEITRCVERNPAPSAGASCPQVVHPKSAGNHNFVDALLSSHALTGAEEPVRQWNQRVRRGGLCHT